MKSFILKHRHAYLRDDMMFLDLVSLYEATAEDVREENEAQQ